MSYPEPLYRKRIWFAWRPVRTYDGWRWLTHVRKIDMWVREGDRISYVTKYSSLGSYEPGDYD